jgi:prepilin-type N-terminal cleavage/methylation domain-containing protein
MVSLKNKSKGFTIVELLIVIVVIGILATLVIVTFTGIQQKARNSQRQTDVNAVDSHVEAYYASSGNYPTFSQLSDATWRAANLKGLDAAALIGPKAGTLTHTSAAPSGSADGYNYYATESGNANAECTATGTTDDTACDTFTVQALLEGGTTVYTKKSN